MAITLSFVQGNLRRNGNGDFENDSIENLKAGDNVMFGKDASETDFITAQNLARSKALRFAAERECANSVIQVWTVPI